MYTAEVLVKVLEEANVTHIFGHPGEQILQMYKALNNSNIQHVLVRHEQAAAHAADAYARSTGKFGVCMTTASPGALNLIMGVSTAYKDSVPMLVITGDNPYSERFNDNFQTFDLPGIFKQITIKNFAPTTGKEAIINLKEAIQILQNDTHGPVHINLPKDVLIDKDIGNVLNQEIIYDNNYSYGEMNLLISLLKSSKKPLIIAGAGVIWSNAVNDLKNFVKNNNIPIVTTYHSKGLIDEDHPLNLGMVGIRGTSTGNYAYLNSDLILVLGSKLSERTIASSDDFNHFKQKIVDVNINREHLKGRVKIYGDVKEVLNKLLSIDFDFNNYKSWLDEIYNNQEELTIDGINDKSLPLKPQSAIKTIFDNSKNSYIIGDAGSHATWTLLLAHPDKFGKFMFSGALAPMGFAIPASIGVSIAHPNDNIIVINGDGGFQMCIQELATISENQFPVTICVLNNSQLGIIRQWEKYLDKNFRYQVDLNNPNFLSIAKGYGIGGEDVTTSEELEKALKKGINLKKPYLINIKVREEDIPLPNS